jgi:hypothetical protein
MDPDPFCTPRASPPESVGEIFGAGFPPAVGSGFIAIEPPSRLPEEGYESLRCML